MENAANCDGQVVDLRHRNLRIASIFIIFAASLFGALAPVFLARQQKMHVPKFAFFICKYVGTGVIIATAWMHLLAPAIENLSDPCLKPRLGDYSWALAIPLMTIMVMFFVELLAARLSGEDESHDGGISDKDSVPSMEVLPSKPKTTPNVSVNAPPCPHDVERDAGRRGPDPTTVPGLPDDVSYPPGGEAHLAHGRDHEDGDSHGNIAGQLTAIFILEFGVVFHSVFVGLTLGTTNNLVVVMIVLIFHQLFEGLGLGSRLATAPWPATKQWLPYALGIAFAFSTPIGTAIGIAAKPKDADTQKLINGIFDSISAGILMYTGLVELLAHEFMFNPHMRKAPLKIQLLAFGCVCSGVAVMALLAEWA